jgi:hypothetical protein
MMKGGGIRYGRSYGAESVENVEFARSKRSSNKMNGTKSSLPYALGVSLERTRNGLPQVGKEKRANGSRTPPTSRRGDPEQPMGKESRSGTLSLSPTRMRGRELNGAHASTESGCLQHTLGMLDVATKRVFLTREDNEVTNEKDEREGKPVARQLAPMISKFIRAQWESEELGGVDDERRQILKEAAELDRIWGVWEAEEEPTNIPSRWIRQPSRSRDDMRHHVAAHASPREKEWESPSASLIIEQDPEVVPDVDYVERACC